VGNIQDNIGIVNESLLQNHHRSWYHKQYCRKCTVIEVNYVYPILQVTCCVEALKDLTGSVEVKASSRQAMIGSLTDSSTETFWESGDEDR
jgi:hypothetical protein